MRLSFQRKVLVVLATVVSGAIHAGLFIAANNDLFPYELLYLVPGLFGGLLLGCLTTFFLLPRERRNTATIVAWLVTTTMSYGFAVGLGIFIMIASWGVGFMSAITAGGLVGALILCIGYTRLIADITKTHLVTTAATGAIIAFIFASLAYNPSDSFLSSPTVELDHLLFIVWPTCIMALLLFWPNQKEQIPQIPK